MEDNLAVVAIVLLVPIALVSWRLVLGSMDRDRIRQNVENRGDTVVSIHWTPFGRGWFTESKERHYRVVFTRGSATIETACKTSVFTGVYWSGDEMVTHDGMEIRNPDPEQGDYCSCGCPLDMDWHFCPTCGRKRMGHNE